jgi:hypothetical protein
MKKYILGFLAIVLAIGFSAFTSVKKEKKSKVLLNTYAFWYDTQASGTQVGTLFYSGTAVDKNSVPNCPCVDANLPVCMVGSNTALTQGTAIPSPAGSGDPNIADDADNYILEQ